MPESPAVPDAAPSRTLSAAPSFQDSDELLALAPSAPKTLGDHFQDKNDRPSPPKNPRMPIAVVNRRMWRLIFPLTPSFLEKKPPDLLRQTVLCHRAGSRQTLFLGHEEDFCRLSCKQKSKIGKRYDILYRAVGDKMFSAEKATEIGIETLDAYLAKHLKEFDAP